jgi:hypothetical protein
MTKSRSEEDLVKSLLGAESIFGDAVKAVTEVRSHGRARTDVVLLCGSELVGIEVKKSDWRRAIAQAVLNRYCVDRSYIALHTERLNDSVLSEARQWGIGVIGISASGLEIQVEATKGAPDSEMRRHILESIEATA